MAPLNSVKSNPPEENLVVVIDDDEIMRLSCEQILEKVGYRVETFANGHDGIRRLQEVGSPLLLVDIKMPELDGFEVIDRVRKLDPSVAIVVITGYATIETAVDAMKAGAYDFLPKPFTPGELRMIVDRGFERWRLIKEGQRLRHEKEEAERKFITLVSHQLKTPLVAVKQYLDVLLFSQQGQLPARAVEWVTRSQVRLGEMLTLIQDWLALAKIERGRCCDRGMGTQIAPIVDDIVQDQRQLPAASDLTIDVALPPTLPPVCGDRVSISMLVSNLIGNAIKYNRPGGSVSIRAFTGGKQVTLEVSDTGIGIPKDCLSHLFEEFYRVNTKETRDIPGTGLGLVICNRIVTELGGSIEVSSTEGRGTTVLIHLPVAETQTESS
ncbi:MAG: hybrid sensor histidine kinase/response regulator [Acidobacteriota bacterium]